MMFNRRSYVMYEKELAYYVTQGEVEMCHACHVFPYSPWYDTKRAQLKPHSGLSPELFWGKDNTLVSQYLGFWGRGYCLLSMQLSALTYTQFTQHGHLISRYPWFYGELALYTGKSIVELIGEPMSPKAQRQSHRPRCYNLPCLNACPLIIRDRISEAVEPKVPDSSPPEAQPSGFWGCVKGEMARHI